MFLHKTKEKMLGNFVLWKKKLKIHLLYPLIFFPDRSTSIGNGFLALVL